MKIAKIAPPYSQIAISDRDRGVTPEFTPDQLIIATSSCIIVGCLAFMDGETEIALGPSSEVDPGRAPAFDNMLDTPYRSVVVSTVEDEIILRLDVPEVRTRVKVWVNYPTEPDSVIIGVEGRE